MLVAEYGFTIATLRKLQLEMRNSIALYSGHKRKTVGLLNRKVGCDAIFPFPPQPQFPLFAERSDAVKVELPQRSEAE